ncbi:MAG TPA: pseudouridine synthase [Syntrophomonadaceae bacterium]|nr:pseudouridine synthase [Syntrophomonadaceae bacterium]
MRLAKYLANSGLTSRRKAELLISSGQIKINGIVVTELATKIDPNHDVVEFNRQIIKNAKNIYILLNKPAGYISSVNDPHGRPTVIELMHDVKKRIYPVGRLDLDTEGLLIMTNDGDFTNLMLHPRYEIPKTYEVLIKGVIDKKALQQLREGINLNDGLTSPAKVEIIKREESRTLISMEIHEGRKRQVKRMCKAINHPVLKLRRTKFAFLTTKGLGLGKYRYLTENEVDNLIKLAQSR